MLSAATAAGAAPVPVLGAAPQTELDATAAAAAPSDFDTELRTLYTERLFSPLWIDGAGLPTPQAEALIAAVRGAAQRGLNPAHYPLPDFPGTGDDASGSLADFELALSRQAMRLVSHLHRGRADPVPFGFDLGASGKPLDLGPVLRLLASAQDLDAALDALEPPFPAFRRLRAVLTHYLELAETHDSVQLPDLPARVLEPGQAYAGSGALAEHLHLLGDLESGTDAPALDTLHYRDPLVDAVRRFQTRHGLLADGRIGAATLEALRTPLRQRIQQIQLAMERWRWAPTGFSQPPIVVNIPEFRLRAVGSDGRVALESEVVVGIAFDRQTPVFVEQLRTVVFRPSWQVPTSIVRRSLLPQFERDPEAFARGGFEIVGSASQELTPENILALRQGKLTLRQRPGPANALGAVKFLFPNHHAVYLHDTPSTTLFARARRDFSSGCVRVQEVAALAAWVLRNQPDWTPERIREAMTAGRDDAAVAVVPPIPVYLVYVTAVAPEGGGIRFFDDIYGHDARLARALGLE